MLRSLCRRLLDPPLSAHLAACEAGHLFACYRWVLILFKRELPWGEVLRCWDALFARHPMPQLHLYMCVAALIQQRR